MSERRSAYDQALRLLARRPHFRAELTDKLARRDYGREEIAEALVRLEDHGYVDDLETARTFVTERRRRRHWGRARVRAELGRRGVDREAVATVLDDLEPEADLDLARQVAAGWGRGRDALARRLSRLGFDSGVIVAVLEGLADETPPAASP